MSNGDQPDPQSLPSGPASAGDELRDLVLGRPSIEDFLQELAGVAADIAAQTHCGVTLDHHAQPVSVAATDAAAAALDEVQSLFGDGPGLLAMRTGVRVDAPALADDERWVELGSYASAFGVGSGLFLPLVVRGDSIGVLSVYAPGAAGLDEDDVRRVQLIADEAAAGVSTAVRRFSSVPDDQLARSLATRRVIDQALGILMHADQVSSRAARGTLLDLARTSNRSPGDVAAQVVETTTSGPA